MEQGQTLGHYLLESVLGRGGMGEVFKAHDSQLDRVVALKVLPNEFAHDPGRLRRFKREARALASLNHPNIVTVFAVEVARPQPGERPESVAQEGSDGLHEAGILFITMEFVDGDPLSRAIPRTGMSLDKFFSVAVPMADALAAAHEAGIVHRDLKPANVMLDRTGRPKVLDFGLALTKRAVIDSEGQTQRSTATLETAGTVLGTVGYMSPEQVKGETVDARSDLFSLGVVLYEMATGRRAFDAPSSAEYLSAVLRDTPRPVERIRPELPRQLGRIIRRCLEKDPDRRFQSAKDVRNELDDLVRELETEAILESRSVPSTEPVAENRSLWPVIVAVLAAMAVAGFVAYRLVRRGIDGPLVADRPPIQSLAVLPFDNLMNDPEQMYFVEGMHEALITDLSKIGALRVISRTSAMRYAVTDKTLPEIASELDVDVLVEGSVFRVGGTVRITAQLIDGQTDEHLWAQSYDRELENILALLSEVAQAIAKEIEVTMTVDQRERLTAVQPVNPAAYEAFLKGTYSFNQFRGSGFREAIRYFNEAIDLQPDFADAYAKLSGAHLLLGGFGIEDAEEQEVLARENAARALELDPQSAAAHSVIGWLEMYFHWNWPAAAENFERALEIDPYDLATCHGYGDYLTVMGRGEEGLEYIKRAAYRDPLSPLGNGPIVGHLMFMRHYDEAIAKARMLLELDPDYPAARMFLSESLWHKGDQDQALAEFRLQFRNDEELLEALDRGSTESPEEAMLEVARVLADRPEAGRSSPLAVAKYFALGGEVESAFDWLERAFDERVPQLMLIKQQPTFDNLRSDSRFDDLVRRIGIPD